ncbi:uncharacterized protein BX663DRAFT_513590 [Cokeromyces recurvatus]|uniref:uncharacterized protein n=1 Tax=Cokeromyces recurvatus TaxID=90255 RepID=UPI0022211715|nr:uncharacterized protein BX663DRAFT_513590 [Cokeromyces recurvatus]KAI7901659.1 hypothetical protein BX663DRAFT_513590 [Cokeromyces recurvatus]
MIGVCCVNNKVYPYLIILEFNYEPKAVERPFRNAQCVYKNDEIKEWIDNLNRSVQHLDRPLSTYFKSRELGKKYPTFKQIEPMLEFILSKLYENLNNDSTTVTKQSVNQPYSTTELSVGKDEMRRTKDERKRTQTENLIKKDVKHASVTLHEKQGSQTKVAPKQKTNKRSIMDDIFANYDYKPKKRKEINASISQQSVADKKDVSNEAERTSRQQLGKKNEPELSKPNTEAASHSENTIKSTIPKCIHLISAKEYQKTVEARFNAMTIIPDEECIIPSSQISITKTSVENNLTTTLNSSNTTTNHIHSGKQIKRFLSDNDLRIEEYRLSSLLDVLSDFNIEYEKIIIESNPYKKRKHFSKLRTVNALLHF